MKLKTRLIIGFMIIIIIPVMCSLTIVGAFSQLQIRNIEKNYGVTASYQSLINPISMLNKVTENLHHQLMITSSRAPEQLEDEEYLNVVNENLASMNSYLIVISYKKRVTSPGSMHGTGCLGLVHWDDPEGWYGEEGGRGVQDGEHRYTCGRFMLMY